MESNYPAVTEADSGRTATDDWRRQLQHAVRDSAELERLLELEPGSLALSHPMIDGFPLLVPRSFVDRMGKGNASDPLLLQVLPTAAEALPTPEFSDDPVAEQGLAQAGTLGKYPGRALLIATGACPVHCRYCFRRSFPYADQTAARGNWQPALDALSRVPNLTEVIVSGGDPLSLGNRRLEGLIRSLETIESVTTLRIHTRFPIVLPARVDAGLVDILGASRLNVVVVVHANHPAEIDTSVKTATRKLGDCAKAVLNQSVLLKGVNDRIEILETLSWRLLDAGVVPYYIHQLDRVSAASRFEIADAVAVALISGLRQRLPGYLVPRLVREIPGELSKTPII